MTSDIFHLRDAIESLAVTFPHDAKAAELRRSFSDWWNHERPHLPPEGGAWKKATDDFQSAYITAFARLFFSSTHDTSRTRSQALSSAVHAGMHLGFTSTEHGSLPFALLVAAKSFFDLIASPPNQKG